LKVKINRVFTANTSDPYDGINFVKRTSQVSGLTGKTSHENENVTVPEAWSQVAVDILAQKYFRKKGLGADKSEGESDSRQVFDRLVGCWAHWGQENGYFDTPEDVSAFKDELKFMLARQMAAPNSPQWFNTGLHWAYGIDGPAQGHYFVDQKTGVLQASTSAYERPQPHACFIQSVNDDLVGDNGIMDLWQREARLFKYGSGTGSNFSGLRGRDENLSGGGKSSGLMSFLVIGDKSAGAIKSGGTTRRAAKMVILNTDHPDIEDFIDWKVNEERKVVAMAVGSQYMRRHWDRMCKAVESHPKKDATITNNEKLKKAVINAKKDALPQAFLSQCLGRLQNGDFSRDLKGYDTDWQGEAYQTVNGMNANNSIRIPNEFMDSIKTDRDWKLTARTDGRVMKTVKAKDLWNKINHAAWMCADPGIQFDTTINDWHTCLTSGRINGSNPCSEYMFLDDTACNLASLNLCTFLKDGLFNIEQYKHATRIWTIVLEISVMMAQYPSPEIAQKSYDFRTLGLGYANLGALLMRMGLAYDSEVGRQWAGALTAIMTGESYAASAEMAKELGAFPKYQENADVMLRVIRNHRYAAYNAKSTEYEDLNITPVSLKIRGLPKPIGAAVKETWDRAFEMGKQYGYRNAQTTLLAPTGTIGLIMDCDTTGVEPDFALVKFKKLAGGGYMKLVNGAVPSALEKLGYSKKDVESIVNYAIGTRKISDDSAGINLTDLKNCKVPDDVVMKIERSLPSCFDPSFLFTVQNLGENLFTELGLDPKSSAGLLEQLGFSQDKIEMFYEDIYGRATVEGAPELKDEHLSVFDCASKCGKTGKRFVKPMGHVEMMAATQPFLSGAISKTVNLPAETGMDEVAYIHEEAWKLGLKSIAIYRDGSKMSQAMATNLDLLEGAEALLDDSETIHEKVKVLAEQLVRAYRKKLPTRRGGYTQSATVGTTKIYLRTGEYEDGKIGEIFIDTHKEGTAFRSLLNSFAIAISIGLQYGVPLDEFCDAFLFTKFEPAGMVTGNDHIKMASSIIDYIFRELAITYLGKHELSHKGEEAPSRPRTATVDRGGQKQATLEEPVPVATLGTSSDGLVVKTSSARTHGYTGDICSGCGSIRMVRGGTCLKCLDCGTTTGCS
jgi:ribonucleoside-diphosphate reductase alpha chain